MQPNLKLYNPDGSLRFDYDDDDSDNADDNADDNDDDDNADDNADDDEINVKNKIYDMLQEYYNNKTSDQWKDSNWKQLGSKLANLDTENEQKNMRHELKHGGYYEALAICRNIDKVMKEFEPNNLFGFYGVYVNQNNFTEKFKETYNFFIKDTIDKFFNNEIEELKKNKDQYIQKINDLKNRLFNHYKQDIINIFYDQHDKKIKDEYQQYQTFLNKIINEEDLDENEKRKLFEIILSENNIKSYFGNKYLKYCIDNYEVRLKEKKEEYKSKTYLKAVIRGIKKLNCEKDADNVFHYESYVEIPSKRNALKENDDHLKGTYVKFDALSYGTLDDDVKIFNIIPSSEDKCNYLILLFKLEENGYIENDYKVITMGNGSNRCWINATLYAFVFGIMEFNNRQGGGRIIEDKYEDNLLNEIEEDLDNDFKDNLLNEIEEDLDNDYKDNLLNEIEEDLDLASDSDDSDDSDELE